MMTAKQYFRRVLDAERRIRALRAEHEHLIELATGSARFASSGVHARPGEHSHLELAIIRMIDTGNRLGDEIDACLTFMAEARVLISRIPDPKLRDLLTFRYLGGHTWKRIARELRYDERYLFKLHGLALREADRILNNPRNKKEDSK